LNLHSFRAAGLAILVAGGLIASSAATAQTRGGTLYAIAQPEPALLMLGLNQQSSTQYVAGKIYESLLRWSPDLKPLPGLAKSWKISGDGLTYTFALEPNVKWHDGKPFSSEDVVFSIDKFLRKSHPRSRVIINQVVDTVKAIDKDTVEIKLKQPFGPFLTAFVSDNLPMVPKHIYDNTDYAANPANQTPIGTGPFKFKEWRKGSHIILERNPNYWKPGLPYLDSIVFRVIPDSASRAVAFENNTVQVLRSGDVDNVDVKRLRELPNVDFTTAGWEMFSPLSYVVMNERKPPFNNIKVRQAVMHAINRKFVVDNIFFGFGKVATGPISSTTAFYDPNVTRYDYDPAKAKALLKESGVDVGAYPVKLLAFPYGSTWERLTEYVRQSLQQVGFKVDIEAADSASWSKRMSDFDFDFTFSFSQQYGDPALGVSRHFLSTNAVKGSPFVNNQGYANPKVDELWLKGATATTREQRQAAYTQLQKILVDEVANGYLFEIQNPTLSRKNVRNLVTTAIGLNDTFDTVSIEK